VSWFWNNFPQKPSIFFIGDIDTPDVNLPGADIAGLCWAETFVWIPDCGGLFTGHLPDEDVSLAHEIGHILGLGHDDTNKT
jgi:hypothetical protein